MTPEQEERMIMALEMASMALASMAKTYELQYFKTYPPQRMPRDIEVTRPLTKEEELRQNQGATGESTTQEWMTLDEQEIGPRTREFDQRQREAR
jgi:hypothetical protein